MIQTLNFLKHHARKVTQRSERLWFLCYPMVKNMWKMELQDVDFGRKMF